MTKQSKQYKTIEELIEILKERGCIISDISFARETLSKINYYRLTAYLLPFKDKESKEERYIPNTTFEKIVSLHEFDRKLRSLLLQAIDCIEVTLRARLARTHVKNHNRNPIAYLNPKNFRYTNSKWQDKVTKEEKKVTKEEKEENFKQTIEKIILNNRKDDIIKHHENKYGGKLPLWVIIEFFTFGDLSRFYSNLETKDKKEIAKQFISEYIDENSRPDYLKSWFRCCTDVRNKCAHFGVLYNHPFSSVPMGFDATKKFLPASGLLCSL
ncbi:MAG: Abi family protein [Acetobacter sp.]|nr:Abi family protein [Acetobacter sp.]MBO6090673.1 Abi family protein [Acetobacter sp.]